uniref:Ribonuclease H-like domain-containing protein n=1 Tax=Tanacetum cinerariifolium TaxID=118510 RepID=A0A6L2LHL9_TANCI|nr:ribonuclease H-like domain-containing protein [Tanacetum cinerariifolium]
MISTRLKMFYKKKGRKLHFDAKEPVGFDKNKVECFNCYNTRHFAREYISKGNQESRRRDARNTGHKAKDNGRIPAKQDESKALVTIDGKGVNWTGHAEDDIEDYALMAFNSSNSSSDTEVTSCSKECENSYAKLKKLYDEQREQLGVASIEIQAYTLALKRFPVNDTGQNFSSQAASTSTVRKVNTTRQTVNAIRPIDNLLKSYTPITRPFNRTIAPKAHFTNHKVNNAGDKTVSVIRAIGKLLLRPQEDNPHQTLKGKGIVDSRCSRHMTRNKAYLVDYQDFSGSPVTFAGSKGQITGKGKIKTGKLNFKDVCFVKELQHFNLLSVSQMCDKKNKVLFTETECLVLSPDFKLLDENQVLLRVPRQNNMYSFNLENIVPSGGLSFFIANAIVDESNK